MRLGSYDVPEYYDHLIPLGGGRLPDRSLRYVVGMLCLELGRGGQGVDEVLASLDFPDVRLARRHFRARVGLTPEAYRTYWAGRRRDLLSGAP